MGKAEQQTFDAVHRHYQDGFSETDKRRTGKGRVGSISFDEADELFRSWLDESKWPYDALLFDPRVFTFIFEKTSRLLGNQLRGHLVPREGSDVLGAYINNEILDFQWDQANHGGSMLSKWAMMDINTRKYGAAFGICKWRYEEDKKGRTVFDGSEMQPLNNRDCAHELAATSIETSNWFQVREYVTLQDLQRVNDAKRGTPIYQNLDKLKEAVAEGELKSSDNRDTNWISRNRTISGLTNSPYGNDAVFKHIEIVTEYRKDEWITFTPKHGILLREIDNPYKNYEIPIVMLRYYPIDDDIYGLSEIEPIKSLQKAVNALLCQYVDEINQKLYSPIAIGPGVRQSTLEWGKGSRWMMNNPMTDFRMVESQSNAAQYFNNTYSVLVAGMMNALGEGSLGVSNIDRMQNDKTATEVKYLVNQRNSRDNFNQIALSEAIERQMKLWYSMNQSMIFSDPKKKYYVIRIVGKEAIRFFQEQELDKSGLTPEGQKNVIDETKQMMAANPDLDLISLQKELENKHATPYKPVETPEGKLVPKFSINNGIGSLYVEPVDLMGTYDFVADVKSMALGAGEEEKAARNKAITSILSNPQTIMLLQQEEVKPKFKELFIAWLEDSGFKDADRFFEGVPTKPQLQTPQPRPTLPGQPSTEQPPQVGSQLPQLPNMNEGVATPQVPINVTNLNKGVLERSMSPARPI